MRWICLKWKHLLLSKPFRWKGAKRAPDNTTFFSEHWKRCTECSLTVRKLVNSKTIAKIVHTLWASTVGRRWLYGAASSMRKLHPIERFRMREMSKSKSKSNYRQPPCYVKIERMALAISILTEDGTLTCGHMICAHLICKAQHEDVASSPTDVLHEVNGKLMELEAARSSDSEND